MLLVAPILCSILQQRFGATLALFALAAASDAADGQIARRFGWQSALGRLLDPAADKLMLATVFVALAWAGRIPLWLMAAVLVRDAVIVLGAAAYRLRFGPFELHPSRVSKLNTAAQMLFVFAVTWQARFGQPNPAWLTALGALVFLGVGVSGIAYVVEYSRLAATAARRGAGRPTDGAHRR